MDPAISSDASFPIQPGPFAPTWDSLRQYRCPNWFRDAKFGIWAHWGPQSVPEFGDWYARNLYIQGNPQYAYHLAHYGHPSVFGYKDIVQLWKAENFDPVFLIDLYQKAGARYFVTQAVHCDNFDCWDSSYHRWNSLQMGPRKDIVGLWQKAASRAGLRFGVTEHHARSYSWFNTNKGADLSGPLAGVPYDGAQPENADFYFEKHDDTNYAYPRNPSAQFVHNWYMRMQDLVEKYDPDFFYTDGAIPFGAVGRSFVAGFYNHNIQHHGGRLEAVYTLKDMRAYDLQNGTSHGEFMPGIGVQDVERGVIEGIHAEPWQTDTCLGDWFYLKDKAYKPASMVIKMLVDIVSKNGNLLLNLPLRPDGSLDEKEMEILRGITAWMAVNSEAIYDTRPWAVFGEGPSQPAGGHFNEQEQNYSPEDFRFTQKDGWLYVFCLGWPAQSWILVKALAAGKVGVESVYLLGSGNVPEWKQEPAGLRVRFPDRQPCETAWVLKIRLKA